MTVGEHLKRAAKRSIASLLYATRVLHAWQRVSMRHKAVVLMYHRVLTPAEQRVSGSHPAIVVERETFARHMALLKRDFRVLSIAEFAAYFERRQPLPDCSCVITFDDGWQDSFTNATPILAKVGVPALVFLPVNFIGRRRIFVREALTHLLVRVVEEVRRQPSLRSRFAPPLAAAGMETLLDVSDPDPRDAVIDAIGTQPVMATGAIESLAESLPDLLGIRAEELTAADGFIDWGEAEIMTRQGVDFGAHGTEHRLLTQLSEADAWGEIAQSKQEVESRVPPPVATFSYPNGRWTPALADLVHKAGYQLAFTTERGLVSSEDNPFAIRRLNVHQGLTDSNAMFMARLVGLF